jgi:hypothetical protein
LVVVVGRSLLAGLVRAVPVVVSGVLAEDGPQVPFTVDEHPVGALGSCAAYPVVCQNSTKAPDLGFYPRRSCSFASFICS